MAMQDDLDTDIGKSKIACDLAEREFAHAKQTLWNARELLASQLMERAALAQERSIKR